MGKSKKKTNKRGKMLVAGAIALCVALAAIVGLKLSGTVKNSGPEKELQILSVSEEGDDVVLVTTYGVVRYPYAFSDLLHVEANTLKNHAVLEFGVMLDGTMVKLYSLVFNGTEGIPVGTLKIDGDTYPVTALIHEVSGVSDDSMVTVFALQETFNDVVNSLSENEGFTAVTD